LIGDSWNVGTPVIAQAEHYELRHGENAWVVPHADDLPAALRRLREQPALFDRLRQGGRAAVAAHTVDSVANDLFEALRACARPQSAA
jgi:glycosyltransferase involved in cell wall biosynthesis